MKLNELIVTNYLALFSNQFFIFFEINLEPEVELIQAQMAQKPMLWVISLHTLAVAAPSILQL